MRDTTIWRSSIDGKARIVAWKYRDNPTDEESNPPNSRITIFTPMPHDWMEYIKNKTEDEVNEILSVLIP